jgi:radical SAM family RiPP maturation amino acid epimerase
LALAYIKEKFIAIDKPMPKSIDKNLVQQNHEDNLLESQLFEKLESLDRDTVAKVSYIKRFNERWYADPNFRKQVSTDPESTFTRYQIKLNPQEIRPLWDRDEKSQLTDETSAFPLLKACKEFNELIGHVSHKKSISDRLKEPRIKAWRERQIARTSSQFIQKFDRQLGHFPVAFELNKGCSVGCSFCGVAAPRLSDIFFYDRDNAKLWREVLEVVAEVLGLAAGMGFCYWATDPLDNPDYEKFCRDFYEILGIFPHTTTALSLRNPERTRNLLKLATEKKCVFNRFSVLSLPMLDRIHQEFSAEELALVDLAIQNKESGTIQARSGRLRAKDLKQKKESSETFSDSFEQGTIACVSGFLFNTIDRSVKLISPCRASDRWPLGYILYDRKTFNTAKDLKIVLERMIEDNMSLTVRQDRQIKIRSDLKYESLANGFQLSTRYKKYQFTQDRHLKQIGESIYNANKTAQEIASDLEFLGIPSHLTFSYLNLMFDKGFFDEL